MSMKFYTAHKGMLSRVTLSDVIVTDPKEKLQQNENDGLSLPEGVSAHGKKRPVHLRQRVKNKKVPLSQTK